MTEPSAIERFTMWYVEPIEILKTLPDGRGGFVAFMVGLALYERLVTTRLKLQEIPATKEHISQEMARDLELSSHQQSVFWRMFRDGLFHRGMPFSGKSGFYFHDLFSAYPSFQRDGERTFVCIDPWKFTDRVIREFLAKPELIEVSASAPLPKIADNTRLASQMLIDWHQKNTDTPNNANNAGTALWPKPQSGR